MIVTINDDCKYPHIYVEDVFEPEALEKIDQELYFYKDNLFGVEELLAGYNSDKEYVKSAKGFFLDAVYRPEAMPRLSYIVRGLEAVFSSEVFNQAIHELGKSQIIARMPVNSIGHLISYYENNDYYHAHIDTSRMTSLFWYYREPKSYKGGNLRFHHEEEAEPEMMIESKKNCLVMFPSIYFHSVEKIEMINDSKDGRFTVSTFFNYDINFSNVTRELP